MEDLSYFFSPSELSSLLNSKSERYRIKSFKGNRRWAMDNLVLQDKWDGVIVKGTLVKRSSEEFRQRPWLYHRNLAAVVDMVTINDEFSVFVSAYHGKSLRQLILEESFVNSPNCFALKKIYIEDVLWGLDYLHRNNLCLMNLSDANISISICEETNKAIISDFGCLSDKNSESEFSVPFINQPPEYEVYDAEGFQMEYDKVAAEMWIAGMMILEVFTQHKLPWDTVDYEKERTHEMMISKEFNEVLKVANFGSTLSLQDLDEFKEFASLLIDIDPRKRTTARNAATAKFLQSSKNSVSLKMSPRCPSLQLNAVRHENEFQCSPSIFQKSVDHNKNSKQYRDNFETPKNQPEKCSSSVSFKECVYPAVKPTNSDFQSYYTRPSDSTKFEIKMKFGQSYGDNSKSNNSLNRILAEYSEQEDVQPSPDTQSKISVSSQTERLTLPFKKFASGKYLNRDISDGVSSKNCLIGSKVSFSENLHFGENCPVERKEVPGKTEMNRENNYAMPKYLVSKNKLNTCITNDSYGQFCAPCYNINSCKISNDNYLQDCVLRMSDRLPRDGKMPNQCSRDNSTRIKKDSSDKVPKSTADLNKSTGKFRISIPYDPQEAMRFYNMKAAVLQEIIDSKTKPKTLNKTPYTLSNNNISYFPKSQPTASNTPHLRHTTDGSVKNDLEQSNLKEIERGTFNPLKQLEDLNKKIVEMKAQMKNISDLKRPCAFSVDCMKNSDGKNSSNDAKTNEELRNRRFQCGSRCLIHQRAQGVPQLDEIDKRVGNVHKDNESNSKNNCQTCADTQKEEPKVPEKSYVVPLPLPQEYWVPTKTHFETKKSPVLQPSPLSRVSSKEVPDKDCKNTGPAIPNQVSSTSPAVRVQNKENGIEEQSHESSRHPPPKIIVIRGPCRKGRSLVRVEQAQTKQKKYAKKKDAAKNSKKSEKNSKARNASAERMIESDSSDEKKQSKKKKALRRCFCIGK